MSNAPEFEPPVACVNRIVKSVLPDNIMMSKDARTAFVRAAGVFIFYLTHCSNEFSRECKRSTVFPQDILNALRELGFEDFERPLEEFLEAYKKETDSKKASKAKKIANAAASVAAAATREEEDENDGDDNDEEEEEEEEEDGAGDGEVAGEEDMETDEK